MSEREDAANWHRLTTVGRYVRQATGAVALAFSGLMPNMFDGKPGVISAVVLAVIGIACEVFSVRYAYRLEQARTSEQSAQALESVLCAAKKTLNECADEMNRKIGSGNKHHIRTTIYAYDFAKERFIPLVRRSPSQRLRSVNRQFYPKDQGYIGEIWDDGFKSFQCDPEEVDKEALERNIPPKVVEHLTMRATSAIGVTLEYKNEPAGVLLVECDDSENPIEDDLGDLRESDALSAIGALVFSIRDLAVEIRDCDTENTQPPIGRHGRRLRGKHQSS